MEYDGMIQDLRDENRRLFAVAEHLTRALAMHNEAIAELYAHSQEHHNVINGHARALETLEALMIGGDNEDGN